MTVQLLSGTFWDLSSFIFEQPYMRLAVMMLTLTFWEAAIRPRSPIVARSDITKNAKKRKIINVFIYMEGTPLVTTLDQSIRASKRNGQSLGTRPPPWPGRDVPRSSCVVSTSKSLVKGQ